MWKMEEEEDVVEEKEEEEFVDKQKEVTNKVNIVVSIDTQIVANK